MNGALDQWMRAHDCAGIDSERPTHVLERPSMENHVRPTWAKSSISRHRWPDCSRTGNSQWCGTVVIRRPLPHVHCRRWLKVIRSTIGKESSTGHHRQTECRPDNRISISGQCLVLSDRPSRSRVVWSRSRLDSVNVCVAMDISRACPKRRSNMVKQSQLPAWWRYSDCRCFHFYKVCSNFSVQSLLLLCDLHKMVQGTGFPHPVSLFASTAASSPLISSS